MDLGRKWNTDTLVTVEFFGDSDPKGVKTIKYTFTDNDSMDAHVITVQVIVRLYS